MAHERETGPICGYIHLTNLKLSFNQSKNTYYSLLVSCFCIFFMTLLTFYLLLVITVSLLGYFVFIFSTNMHMDMNRKLRYIWAEQFILQVTFFTTRHVFF